MQGKIAIVTGGSKGYGVGIAQALQQAGAQVWITGRDTTALTATAQRLHVHPIVADVTQPAHWDHLIAEVTRQTGRLDILVNNAGSGGKIAPLTEQTDESIAATIATNLTGHLLGCRRAAKIMAAQRSGTIINISSVCARYAWPGWGPYSAAKAGLAQFSHCLYTELRAAGVRVTTLTPSWGATDFLTAADLPGHPAAGDEIRRQTIQPHELGRLVLDLCQLPAHLAIPDLTIQPLVQQIEPM